MPNFDAGCYFYTGLMPVDLRPTRRPDQSITSHSHLLREVLAELPNHSPAERAARPSPFARCHRTHFARLAVIDDPAFNGRVQKDSLVEAITGVDPLVHQPADHLSRSWLIFVADADTEDGTDASRDAWARGLWEVMEPELRAIFRHCLGFRKVDSGEAFAEYLAKTQVETTMSFHDYWIDPPKIPALTIKRMGLVALAPALLFALVAAYLRWEPFHWPRQWLWPWQWHWDWLGILIVFGAALVGLALGVWLLYRTIMRSGAKSYPAQEGAELPGVLKSLYLQRRFTNFAIAQQSESPDELYAAFGRFLDEVRPDDVYGPTQPPGVVPVREPEMQPGSVT